MSSLRERLMGRSDRSRGESVADAMLRLQRENIELVAQRRDAERLREDYQTVKHDLERSWASLRAFRAMVEGMYRDEATRTWVLTDLAVADINDPKTREALTEILKQWARSPTAAR